MSSVSINAKNRILELEDIRLNFGNVHALKGASMYANKGEVTAIIGDNGAGKSSLIKCILGVYHPSSGKICFQGNEVMMKTPTRCKSTRR